MRQTNVRGNLSLRGFRKLRTGAIVATGVILLGLGFLAPTVSASEQDGVWVARTVEEVKVDIQNINNLSHYTIKWGDTLSAISGATGLSVDSLVEINRIANRDLIFANNKLYFSEEAFLKDGNTEVRRQRVSIDNSGSRQSYEVETKTDTVTGEQTTTVKQTTPVVVETPAVSAEKAEESVLPASKSETSVTVAPKSETREEVSNTPSLGATTSADSGESSPVTDNTSSNTGTADQPVASNPSSESLATSTPKAEEPATTEPKAEEPTASAPKDDESASSVESPSTSNHSDESGTPSTTPTGDSTAPKPSDSTSAPVTPSEETPVASGEPNSTEQPAGEAGKTETTAESSNTPSADATNESGNATESSSVTDNAPSNTGAADQPVASNSSSESPETSAPKDDESASSVESPSAGNHSEESGAPSTTPTGDSTATQPSDSTSSPVTPSEETPVTSGESNSTTQPAGETGNSETTAEPSNTPSADPTNESGNAAESSSVTDNAPSNTGAADQPVASNSSSESPATSAPKAEEPATTEPKAEELTSEEAKAKKELADAQKDGEDIINERVSSKLGEIEKVKDEAEKEKLKAELKTLKEEALAAINNAKDHDAAVAVADEYQTKIDEINVPGEELPAPNYNKDNLTNGRNEGTTIDNGSTAIGHGSGEAPTQPASEESTTSTASPTQPSSTSEGASSFRNAPSVQARARRVARSTSEPDGTVNISYNFAGMPDIHGFLSDPGENNTVTIPAGTSEAQAKELVKEKIQAKIKDLAARGYHVKNDIIFEQDTTVKNYNYVVTFTKEATGTSGFRMAPAVQPRASRNRRSLEQPAPQKVKVNVFYNFDQMKDIAGFLGDINGTSLEIAEGLSNEQVKAAVKSQVDAKKEELSKRGYTFKEDYVYQSNGKDYNYVVTFSKAAK